MGARSPEFDVLIAGGGLAGASLGLALAPAGLRVGIVEAQAPRTPATAGYDDRGIALTDGARRTLETLGVWPALAADAEPIRKVHVSESGRAGLVRLDATELTLEALGWVILAPRLGAVLTEAVASCDALEVMRPARVVSIDEDDDAIEVGVDADGAVRRIRTRLLVAADGARSTVRELAGIGAQVRDYGQTAVITNLTPREAHRGVAYERFTPDGPLAFLPLPDARCAIVWTVRSEDADAALALDDTAFGARINDLFGARLGPLERIGRRQAWPLTRTLADEQVRGRVVLVGNAAHSLHPIAAQGFNLSLRECAALAEAIVVGMDAHADSAAPATLDAWAKARRADQRRTGGFIDGLNGLFTSEFPAAGPLRAIGLGLAGAIGPLRRAIARFGAR